METIKQSKPGFIRDYSGNILLPITRAELIKNADGSDALRIVKAHDKDNGTTGGYPGLMDPQTLATILAKIDGSGTNSLSALASQINIIKDSIAINGTACNLLEDVLNFTNSSNIVVSKDTSNNISFNFSNEVKFTKAQVSASPTEDNDVVNKAALDKKFQNALDIASGALHFVSGINALPSAPDQGSYYKVTGNFSFNQGSGAIHVEVGDTLIYANNEWIHIPSGNETETSIQGTEGPALRGGLTITTANNSQLITAQTIANSDGYSGKIQLDLQAASISGSTVTPGYFNQNIYNNLKNLIPAGSTYTPTVTSGYQIGTFTTNSINTPVHIPKLVVDNTTSITPKIKYQAATDTTNVPEAITIKTNNAIVASASSTDNSITIGLNVAAEQPLSVKDGALALNVWKTGDIDNKQGLITFDTFASGLFDNVLFIEVSKPSELNSTQIGYLTYTES